MEHIGAQHSSDTRSQSPTLSRQELGSLSRSMEVAKSYFPNQTIELETSKAWLTVWAAIAGKYGLQRFETALGNVCRGSEWFPLPVAIERECGELKVLATEQQGSRLNLYQCPACPFTCASELRDAPHCRECGQLMAWAARGVDLVRDDYREHAMAHPERFVRVNFAELEAQAIRNIAAKRRVA